MRKRKMQRREEMRRGRGRGRDMYVDKIRKKEF